MSLENIFAMIKADRYTEDGCEELNKAKKEIEDARRTYKPGEISEKTGLQKQSDGGWAPPKGAQQAAGTKQAERKPAAETASGKWQKNEDYLGRERISMKTPQGGKVSIYESDNPKQKNARFRVDTGSHYNEFNTMEEAKAFAEKQYGAESKPAGLPAANHFEAASKAAETSKDKANLDSIKSYMDEEKATFKDALYTKAETLARKGANGNPDIENEQSMMKLAEAAGMGDSLKQYLKEEVNRTYEFGDSGSERTVNGAKKSFLTSKEFSDTENHSAQLEARKKAEKKAKRDAEVKQQRAEGEANARAFQQKVESGEIKYNKETGKFEEQPKKKEYSDFKTKHDLNVSGKSPEEADSYMKENGFELQPESRQDYRVYRNKYGEEVTSHYDDKGNYQGGSQTPAKIPGKDNHRAYAEAKGNKYIGQGKTAFGTVQVYETPEGKVEMADFNEAGEYTGGSTSSKEFYKKWYDFDLNDSSPRVLTGDCRIRIRK